MTASEWEAFEDDNIQSGLLGRWRVRVLTSAAGHSGEPATTITPDPGWEDFRDDLPSECPSSRTKSVVENATSVIRIGNNMQGPGPAAPVEPVQGWESFEDIDPQSKRPGPATLSQTPLKEKQVALVQIIANGHVLRRRSVGKARPLSTSAVCEANDASSYSTR